MHGNRASAMSMPLPATCCSLERTVPEETLSRGEEERLLLPRPHLADPMLLGEKGNSKETLSLSQSHLSHWRSSWLTQESGSPWQLWLQAWGEKQSRDLQLHEEATKEMVESLRTELVAQMHKLEKAHTEREARLRARSKLLMQESKDHMEAHGEQRRSSLSSGRTNQTISPNNNQTLSPNNKDGAAAAAIAGQPSVQMTLSRPSRLMGTSHCPSTPSYVQLNEAVSKAIGCSKQPSKSKTTLQAFRQREFTSSEEEMLPHGGLRLFLFSIVHTEWFNLFTGMTVLAYTGFVGVLADLDMRAAVAGEEGPSWRLHVDTVFGIMFLIEVSMRVVAEGMYFLKGKERHWNAFDALVAIVGMIDILDFFEVNLGYLRIFRTVRVVRVMRIVKIFALFKELRLMIASIIGGLVSLSWAFALLVAVIFVFSVMLLQAASDHLHSLGYNMDQHTPEVQQDIRDLGDHFGTMYRTIYSLTQAISGGRSWGEFAMMFIRISPWYGTCFTLFVVFVVFGVLNILTGVFVEGTSSLANIDRELGIQEEMSRHESVVNQMRTLFKEMDVDNSGTLSFQELTRNLTDERVQAYFSMLQMDVSEANGLFQLLDKDETGEVSIEEFIITCMKLKGSARSIDLATMLLESKRLHATIRGFMRFVEETSYEMEKKLIVIEDILVTEGNDSLS